MEVPRPGANLEVFRRHGLEVVVEDVGRRAHDDLGRSLLAQEVGRQDLDRGFGERARIAWITSAKCWAPPSGRSSRSTEVITTCSRPSFSTALATFSGSARIERLRQPRLHVAERARPGAGVAHDHEGGVLLLPALADIGATGLLADGDELVFPGRSDWSRPISPNRAPSRGSSRACAGQADRADAPSRGGGDDGPCSEGRERRPWRTLDGEPAGPPSQG